MNIKKQKGFTLIETIIYIAIIGLALTSFVVFLVSIIDSRDKNYVIQEVQANARTSLNLISQSIREARDVNIESSIFNTDPGTISLEMNDSNKNPTIIDLNQDDGILRIKQGIGDYIELNSNNIKVTQLIFKNLTKDESNKKNIGIQMVFEYNNQSGDLEFDYSQSIQTAISLRQ